MEHTAVEGLVCSNGVHDKIGWRGRVRVAASTRLDLTSPAPITSHQHFTLRPRLRGHFDIDTNLIRSTCELQCQTVYYEQLADNNFSRPPVDSKPPLGEKSELNGPLTRLLHSIDQSSYASGPMQQYSGRLSTALGTYIESSLHLFNTLGMLPVDLVIRQGALSTGVRHLYIPGYSIMTFVVATQHMK